MSYYPKNTYHPNYYSSGVGKYTTEWVKKPDPPKSTYTPSTYKPQANVKLAGYLSSPVNKSPTPVAIVPTCCLCKKKINPEEDSKTASHKCPHRVHYNCLFMYAVQNRNCVCEHTFSREFRDGVDKWIEEYKLSLLDKCYICSKGIKPEEDSKTSSHKCPHKAHYACITMYATDNRNCTCGHEFNAEFRKWVDDNKDAIKKIMKQ